ncbi:MAG TPA: cupin domain-containing protein [Bacteroidetes bacterium]|nr:cupin domain-containing protein [Bacteroidota bacterium]
MYRFLISLLLLSLTIGCGQSAKKPPPRPPRISPGPAQHWDIGDFLIKYPLPDDVDDFYVQFTEAPGYSFGVVRAHKRLSSRYHESHDLLIYVQNGNVRFHVAERDFIAAIGDVIYVPRGAVYSAESLNDRPFDFFAVYHPVYDGDDIVYYRHSDDKN